ncbi:MAG: hypothetical protein P8Y70_12550 [Candidatus Lokiarchaeota archaeon]
MKGREYNPQIIEEKWQRKWKKDGIFNVEMDLNTKKYYVLEIIQLVIHLQGINGCKDLM